MMLISRRVFFEHEGFEESDAQAYYKYFLCSHDLEFDSFLLKLDEWKEWFNQPTGNASGSQAHG